MTRLATAAAVGLAGMAIPMSSAGADGGSTCDYRTDKVITPAPPVPPGTVGGGAVHINVTDRTDWTVIEDVTVLARWVGEGIDLGPAAEGDPMFETLPDGYSVTEPPAVDREETSVELDEAFRQEVGCPSNGNYGEDWTGDPLDPFSWVTYDDVLVPIDMVLIQEITRTHHITETRTYRIIREDEGLGDEGPGVGEGDDEGPGAEEPEGDDPDERTSPREQSTQTPDGTVGDGAETVVLSAGDAAPVRSSEPVTVVAGRTEARISFTG